MLHILIKAVYICQREGIEYVIGFTVPYGVLSWLAAKVTGRKVGISFIGADLYKGIRRAWYGKVLVSILRRCDHVTVTGKEMRDILVAQGISKDQIHILPHGIHVPSSRVTNRRKEYAMVFVGELVERKRVDILLDAFQLVKKVCKEARFCIVGDGPLRQILEEKSQEMQISDSVDFVGLQENVWPYLEMSKIFALASEGEGLPFAMIEAMVCGLVPVVTDVGTIRDTIKHGVNGFLVNIGDRRNLAKNVIALLCDESLYGKMSANATAVRDDYSYEKTIDAWDKIFSYSGNAARRTF
jgi:glycosyltransferase involved in cell wall biosynthesis